jgi:SAM-dependent methyltransferase
MDKTAQRQYYEGLLSQYGENCRALDWNSVDSQKLRYKIFKEMFVYGKKSCGISVLDVGCGFGDFYGFLKAEGMLGRQRINYTGYDISPKLLEVAGKKYPEARFEVRDVLEDRCVPGFDYVFCSGVFNIRTTEEHDHLEFVKEMIFRMYDLAGCGLSVNFLSEGALPLGAAEEQNSGRYYYFKPEEILRFCRFVCSRFFVRHDYHPGDFTVYLLK